MENSKASGSGLQICLHPLVIMNISEHFTRYRAQDGPIPYVIGAIIGTQIERKINIFNSFELRYDLIEDKRVIDIDFLKVKEASFKEVFANFDFLGWYSCGHEISDLENILLHKQICNVYENPFFLKMNSNINNQLPVTLYESLIDFENGQATMVFREVPFLLETEETERIGLEHIANTNVANESVSMINNHMLAQQNAIKALNIRILGIINYLKDVIEGKLPENKEIVREANSLINRMPLYEGNPLYKKEFSKEQNDIALLSHLAQMSKLCNTINKLGHKINTMHEKPVGTSRRMKGGLLC